MIWTELCFRPPDVWRKIDVEFLGKRGLEVPEDYVETITPMEFKQIADYTIERFHLAETPGGGDGRMEYYGKRCL